MVCSCGTCRCKVLLVYNMLLGGAQSFCGGGFLYYVINLAQFIVVK